MKFTCHVPGLGRLPAADAFDDFWTDICPHLQGLDGSPLNDLVVQPVQGDWLGEKVVASSRERGHTIALQ